MDDYQIIDLDWDTAFFGIPSCKINFYATISKNQIDLIMAEMNKYCFITINNINNISENNYLLAKYTSAFLVDLNYQLEKRVVPNDDKYEFDKKISIVDNDNSDDLNQLEKIAEQSFEYSRFLNDPHLKLTKGRQVYLQWLKNAINDPRKKVICYKEKNKVYGFLVYSIVNEVGVLELVAVDSVVRGGKIGTHLLQAFENCCGLNRVKVGTQADNRRAVQFYIKNGYKLVSSSSIYHMWNINN